MIFAFGYDSFEQPAVLYRGWAIPEHTARALYRNFKGQAWAAQMRRELGEALANCSSAEHKRLNQQEKTQ